MPITAAALRFFQELKRHNEKPWFDAHKDEYQAQVVAPMRELIEALDVRFAHSAPEITGDPRRSMFRIYRDVRFSKDKSPYKTHAACWFWHQDADAKVGERAEFGSAGFYFHLEPGHSQLGAGMWMPPRPALNRIREAIARKPAAFERVVRDPGFVKRFGGLDTDGMLARVPRGFAPDHPAATWLRYQSFTAGRALSDRDVTGRALASRLDAEFTRLLPLVRWLNGAIGLKPASRRIPRR